MPAGDLGGDLALVGGLVREHRLADDVADGEDVPYVGALLLVHRDEPALVDLHARGLGADHFPVGLVPDRDQNLVEHCRLGGLAALEVDRQPVLSGLDVGDLGLHPDVVVALGQPPGKRPDEVRVRAGNERF